jgi:hypothetical protein
MGRTHQLKSERDEMRMRFLTERSAGSSLSDAALLPPPPPKDETLSCRTASLRARQCACGCGGRAARRDEWAFANSSGVLL